MIGNLPPYVTPKQAAENRADFFARLRRLLFWTLVSLPLAFALMAYGYSDQAPVGLRNFTVALDGIFGAPVWTVLKLIAVR